jgi:hypothetical protein
MTYPRYYNARIETMPPKQIQELQERKLRKQLAYNYQNSAFYHQKFDEVGARPEDFRTLEDLAKLPWGDMPPFPCRGSFAFTPRPARRDAPVMSALPGMTAIPGSSQWHASTGQRVCAPTRWW